MAWSRLLARGCPTMGACPTGEYPREVYPARWYPTGEYPREAYQARWYPTGKCPREAYPAR